MIRSGVYALVALDGAPLDAREIAALGLAPSRGPIAARGVDEALPGVVDQVADDDRLTLFVGALDEDGARTVVPASPAARARAALDRFGEGIAQALPGEWSLFDWQRDREITLAVSTALRDPLFYTCSGHRVAIAPDVRRLRALGWGAAGLDEEGLLFALGRAPLRRAGRATTIVPGVHSLLAGSSVVMGRQGSQTRPAAPPAASAPWQGSFEDAMVEAETLLRAIVRTRLGGTAHGAALLSGGLDSSTVAWLAAAERRPDQALTFFCSAAPPGRDDESAYAAEVANHLNLPLVLIRPGQTPNIYRPSPSALAAANAPPLGPRHYLYDAFADEAERLGAPVILDGVYGEATISNFDPRATGSGLRRLVRHARALLRAREAASGRQHPFHVRLAPHRLGALPPRLIEAIRGQEHRSERSDTLGLSAEMQMRSLDLATELRPGRVRMAYPFRDPRLYRLFERFPAAYLVHGGQDRAPARHLMRGRLPDSIRLRPKGTAFSPDYRARLRDQAPMALARLPQLRGAGVDDWLDLDWLATGLACLAAGKFTTAFDPLQVQLTAMAAEFIAYWQEA